jgi:2-C-methyl-D-erythritol 2,4-cyclodiphosphate synthase
MRIGQGFDAHALVAGRPLLLGGIEIPHPSGLAGHSDGDVLLHAVTSALLGALGEGDLGRHFPSSDPALAGVASERLVGHALGLARQRGYAVANLDTTIVAQAPRLAPYTEMMRERIAKLLGAAPDRVNVKVTSTDRLGAIGRGEGIAALAVVLLERA